MNAHGREGDGMSEIPIRTEVSETQPKYKATAAALLERCREFYQNPENEKAFQEWMATRKKAEKKIR